MEKLEFDVVLKEVPVSLKGADGVVIDYTLRELTGSQRAVYDESFDVKVEMDKDGVTKMSPGDSFKMFPAPKFLSMCLYDKQNKLVDEQLIGTFPSTAVDGMHKAALKLSGLDKESLEEAKNEVKGSD